MAGRRGRGWGSAGAAVGLAALSLPLARLVFSLFAFAVTGPGSVQARVHQDALRYAHGEDAGPDPEDEEWQ